MVREDNGWDYLRSEVNAMTTGREPAKLTDPGFCIREADRLVIPVTAENWALVKDEADELNVLQAALVHLVYLDTERTDFQEKVMAIVFTAYLMGRTAEERLREPDLGVFREFIAALDLSGLPADH